MASKNSNKSTNKATHKACLHALHTGDLPYLLELLEQNPNCIRSITYNPYECVINGVNVFNHDPKDTQAMIDTLHQHASPAQKESGIVRLVREAFNSPEFMDIGMQALGEAGSLNEDAQDIILMSIRRDPDQFDFKKMAVWGEPGRLDCVPFAHLVLVALALAGRSPVDLEAMSVHMGEQLTISDLEASLHRGVGNLALSRAMGKSYVEHMTPQSIGWLDQTMKGGLRRAIEDISEEFRVEKGVVLRLLDRANLDTHTQPALPSRVRARI